MEFWEQIQAYGIRNPEFRVRKRAIEPPEDAPDVARAMAIEAAAAGVGPRYVFGGALVDMVARRLAPFTEELTIRSGDYQFVRVRRRSRMAIQGGDGASEMALVIKPELGAQGIYSRVGLPGHPGVAPEAMVIVARSCMLAEAASTGVATILGRKRWEGFRMALTYLQNVDGVHGAILWQSGRIGVAGGLELAA
jgi:ApbE superfamily uncharacterized protein (UPF0280 family)